MRHIIEKALVRSDLHEFGTGLGGNIITCIVFCAWSNLHFLLIIIAVNRYFAVAHPVQVRFHRKRNEIAAFFQYKVRFTTRNTLIVMAACLTISIHVNAVS